MPTSVVIAGIFAYIILSSLLLNLIGDVIPRGWRPTAATLFGLAFFAGWVWLVFGMSLGSARGGFIMLRWWIGLMGGMLIFVGPFALLPHPAMLVLGAILGVAFGSWVATGKATWLHRDG